MFDTLISPDALAMYRGEARIVDCRFSLTDAAHGEQLYRAAHLPGAVYAHLERDLSGPITPASGRHPLPDFGAFCHALGRWGITPEMQVIAYDDTGGAFASRFWWLMRVLGHRSVAVLDGGIQHWRRSNYPLESDLPDLTPTRYIAKPNPSLWLDTAELQQQMQNNEIVLVDARTPERYSGEHEPIDPIAGHIPGAINLSVADNLQPGGECLPATALCERYTAALGGRAVDHTVHYCGSGVFACLAILSMEHAGLTGSKLYPGSWSEWIRDPKRRIAHHS